MDARKQTIFTDSNNNQEVKQFNNYGSTVSIQDGQGKAQFYKYKSNNDVTKASQLASAPAFSGDSDTSLQ